MARSLVIEEDRGTFTATRHPHNGYYAGDFGTAAMLRPSSPARPRPPAPQRRPGAADTHPRIRL
jgi:hypothetical protein